MSSVKHIASAKINCSYCSRDISSRKIQLHERLCQRLMIKCKQCGEIVLIEELDEHIIDNHAIPKKCCNVNKEQSNKKQISSYAKIIEECKYCGLIFNDSINELMEHECFCGSKSEECCLCGILIPKKYYNEHLTTKCINNSTIRKRNTTKESIMNSTESKTFSSIRRKLLTLDKEIEKKYNKKAIQMQISSKIIKRNLFNVHLSQKKKKEESNYTLDRYLLKKHLRSSEKKK